MWAKQFSVNQKWLKKVLIFSSIFGLLSVTVLLGLKWDRILYPDTILKKEKSIIVRNLTSSSTLSEDDIRVIFNIESLLEKKNINTNSVYVDVYRDVYLDTDFAKIIFSLKTDSQKVVNTLISVIDNKLFKTDLQNSQNMLEYIDIRFGNKVFYKYKSSTKDEKQTQLQLLDHSTTTSR